jgi:hypothetical protein
MIRHSLDIHKQRRTQGGSFGPIFTGAVPHKTDTPEAVVFSSKRKVKFEQYLI